MKHPEFHISRDGAVDAINPVTGRVVLVGSVQPRPRRQWRAMREGWQIGKFTKTRREAVAVLMEHVYGKDES